MAATTFKLKEIIKLDDRAGFWQIYSISGKTYFLVPVTKDGKVKGAKYGIIGGKRFMVGVSGAVVATSTKGFKKI